MLFYEVPDSYSRPAHKAFPVAAIGSGIIPEGWSQSTGYPTGWDASTDSLITYDRESFDDAALYEYSSMLGDYIFEMGDLDPPLQIRAATAAPTDLVAVAAATDWFPNFLVSRIVEDCDVEVAACIVALGLAVVLVVAAPAAIAAVGTAAAAGLAFSAHVGIWGTLAGAGGSMVVAGAFLQRCRNRNGGGDLRFGKI